MADHDEAAEELRTAFTEHLSGFTASPVLFVGAGLPRRYLGTPSWTSLLEQLAQLTDREYHYYSSSADDDPAATAALLAQPLADRLWSDKKKTFRAKHKAAIQRPDSALKIYATELIKSTKPNQPGEIETAEIESLKSAKSIHAVITTNYDQFLEDIFPDYRVFVGQDELVFSEPAGVAEIYKIHGSVTDPNSLVLTTADYENFEQRNSYLAAKLLTLFAEHPVIFLGYGMGDPNIHTILSSLAKCLTSDHLSRLQDRLVFVSWDETSKHSMTSTVIGAGELPLPVKAITVPDFRVIFEVLASLEQKISKHTLRQVKDHLYNLVIDNKAQAKLMHVTTTDDVGDDAEFVVGVGVIADVQRRGYKMVDRAELCRDVLAGGREYDADSIVKLTMPELVSKGGNFPVYKYLREAGYLDQDGHIKKPDAIAPKVLSRIGDINALKPSKSILNKSRNIAGKYDSLRSLIKGQEYLEDIIPYFGALGHDEIEISSLRRLLDGCADHYTDADGKLDSGYAKAVCIYDLLRYGPKTDWTAS